MACNLRRSGARRRRRGSAGMTLAEVMVAMTVFVIAAAIALILYRALTRAHDLGQDATEAQQNTRIAFEQLLADLRMAGFNYNPDGATRPDEQIEGAWDTAVTLRADFDFEDPSRRSIPELLLAAGSSPFNVVSTGNDEIVTYALGKPDGSGGTSLVYRADVSGSSRDGTVESVTISNVALLQNNPPYTLYRITGNAGTTGVTKTPVADNIYSMRFRYFDGAGDPVGPNTPGDPADDIGGADTSLAQSARLAIRRVEVDLVGMTPDPDLRYTDATDPIAATRNYRKFRLVQDVQPRNLGYVGRPDLDSLPPTAPTNVVACPGQCNSMLVLWDTPPVTDVVTQWTILRGTSASSLGSPLAVSNRPAYLEGLTAGTAYYFRVRAEDSAGNLSPLSALATPAPATVADVTTPERPAVLFATGDTGGSGPAREGEILVSWSQVTTNVQAISCDPQPTRIRDLQGYRLYRDSNPGFPVNASTVYLEPAVLPAGTDRYQDRDVVACRRYYYDIRAVDKCGNESAALPGHVDGMATTQYVPAAPGALQATPAGVDTVALSWSRVTENTASPPETIRVDTYRVYRLALTSGLTPSAAAGADWSAAASVDVTVSDINAPTYTDTTAIDLPAGLSYYYRVSALTDCPSPHDEGAPSEPREAVACSFSGYLSLDPADGAAVSGPVPVSVYVSGPDAYSAYVVITNSSGQVVAQYGTSSAPEPAPFVLTWNTTGLVPGDYNLRATAIDASGCASSVVHTVSVALATACCIAPQAPVLGPVTGALSSRRSDLLFSLVNNCAQDLQVTRQEISWTNVTGNNPRLDDICYDVPAGTRPEDCTPVLTFNPARATPASVAHSPALSFSAARDSLNPLIVGYKFDAALTTGSELDDLGETITVTMGYQTAGSTGDSACTFLIRTNPLSISTEEPVQAGSIP